MGLSVITAFLGNRWGLLIAGVIAAYLYGFYSVEQPDIQAIVRNAQDGRDAYWQSQLAQERETHDKAIQAALAAADAESDTPADMVERLRLCRESPTCRDKDRR